MTIRCCAAFLAVCLLRPATGFGLPPQHSSVFGKVVDQSTGEPLRKVRVAVQGIDLQTTTDDAGVFRLENVPPGALTIAVSSIGYRLLRREIRIAPGENQEIVFYLGQEASTIHEVVQVTAAPFEEVQKSAPAQLSLTGTEVRNLAGVLIDDPLRSVQTLPGVATGDDFQAYFSVRGGGFQNNGIVVDGVLTHNLAHTIQGQESTGSITTLNGDVVENLTLYSGAFSAKYGDRTAGYLDLTTREGSRDRTHTRIAVSGSNAAIVSEGPLGSSRRGSWIASARKSYIDYLVHRISSDTDLNIGFADVQAKVAHEVSSRQRVAASMIWGRADLGRDPANRGVTSVIDGDNNVGVANLAWILLPSKRALWENRVYAIRETYGTRNKTGEVLDSGGYTELALRSDLAYEISRAHTVEAGVLLRTIRNNILDRRYDFGRAQFLEFDSIHGRYGQAGVYAQDRWGLLDGRVTALFGVRHERTGLTGQGVTNPRASLQWRVGEKNVLEFGWGIFSQFPEALPVLGRNGARRLRAETARSYDAGFERALSRNTRVRLSVYTREESGLLRSRDNLYRLAGGTVLPPDINFRYDNALRGYSRGFDIFVQRRSANRLSGWISYGYGASGRTDLVTGESYPGDFDQKHTVNTYGSYRFSEKWNLSLKGRYGSGFPYPGYFEKAGSDYYLDSERNRERIPYYNRVDVRLNRAFFLTRGGKISLYVEVLNVLNRDNIRYDHTYGVNRATRRVSLGRDKLLPIIPTAGFVWEF